MNNQKYCIGLFQEEGLFFHEEWIIRISKNKYGVYERYDYNLKTKEFKRSKKEKGNHNYVPITTTDVKSDSIIDISNNGMRVEGDCLNNSPFGFVSLINSSNV